MANNKGAVIFLAILAIGGLGLSGYMFITDLFFAEEDIQNLKLVIKEGDRIKSGDIVVVLEAMKMENSLTSPSDGVIKKTNFHAGSSVSKDEVLCIISTES